MSDDDLIAAMTAVIEQHHPSPDHVLGQTSAEEIARQLLPVVRQAPESEPTLTMLAADAGRAAALLRRVANASDGRWTWELFDVADLLTPGAWGADGTPYETVRRRISADIAAASDPT